jgi:uncharacterized cofD-like protein
VRITGIGGGHGLAATLAAARTLADRVDAVVTVADDGGSSGRLSRELGIPPPGDIRNCLVALAEDVELARLYQHRFQSGALTGHTVGNLLIASLTEITGDFVTAVDQAGRLLRTTGGVHPATGELVGLRARAGGDLVEGQVAVAQSAARIQALYLDPAQPAANPAAVEAILAADLVVLGPGSLFTSLIATILVPGIQEAVRNTNARRLFVCNNRMQKGETQGLDAAAHLEALFAHVGPYCVDATVVQWPPLQIDGVAVDEDALGWHELEVIKADLTSESGAHDPERLAQVLGSLSH